MSHTYSTHIGRKRYYVKYKTHAMSKFKTLKTPLRQEKFTLMTVAIEFVRNQCRFDGCITHVQLKLTTCSGVEEWDNW